MLLLVIPPYIGTEEEIDIENSVKDFRAYDGIVCLPKMMYWLFYRKIANDTKPAFQTKVLFFLEINQNWDQKHWNYINTNLSGHNTC